MVVASGYGGPEVLELHDIVLPQPGAGQVLIDVKAAGANAIDYKLYSGHLGNDPDALPMPVGLEVSGVVAAVVPETAGFTGPLNTGDEVIAAGVRGGYAEQLVADAANVGHKPANLSFEQAAGLLVAGSTAWHLLTATTVGAGETVLLHGGAGGVGLLAVQLAVARGAKVIATAGQGWWIGCGPSGRWTSRWIWSAPTRRWTPPLNLLLTAGESRLSLALPAPPNWASWR